MIFLLSILLTLAWDPVPDADLAGYRIYWRTFEPSRIELGGPYLFSLDVGKTNRAEFPQLDNIYYDFVCTAYNTSGLESDFSNEIFCINVREPQTAVNQ